MHRERRGRFIDEHEDADAGGDAEVIAVTDPEARRPAEASELQRHGLLVDYQRDRGRRRRGYPRDSPPSSAKKFGHPDHRGRRPQVRGPARKTLATHETSRFKPDSLQAP